MPQAKWQGAVLANSDTTIIIEGNHYFPPDSLDRQYFQNSSTHTFCSWKGEASYYTIRVGDQTNQDAAWYYPTTKEAAKEIKDYVAFWKGVEIIE
jgi:uncharacterized protein (DUF427 family)